MSYMQPDEHLTGKVRYRSGKRWMKPPILVLQVQATCGDGPSDSNGLPTYLSATYWRDARTEDLEALKEIEVATRLERKE